MKLYITTHQRPPGMQTLTLIRRRVWSGQIASLPQPFFSFFCWFLCQGHRSHCASDEGSKRVVPRKEVPFGGLNDVPLNFGGKSPPKIDILGAWIGLSSLNEKQFKSLKLPSRSWQNFYRRYAPRMRLCGWSHGSPKQIQDGGGHHLWFWKKLKMVQISVIDITNNSGLDKDICTKFHVKMHHGHAEMTTWPKVETES